MLVPRILLMTMRYLKLNSSFKTRKKLWFNRRNLKEKLRQTGQRRIHVVIYQHTPLRLESQLEANFLHRLEMACYLIKFLFNILSFKTSGKFIPLPNFRLNFQNLISPPLAKYFNRSSTDYFSMHLLSPTGNAPVEI